ncbi:MAG: ABC transporter ATP-binding protein [Chloroflexota bacterium]
MPTLRKLLAYLKPYQRDLILSITGMFIGTLGMSLIPWQTQRIIDEGIPTGDVLFVVQTTLLMAVCAVIVTVGMYVNNFFAVSASQNLAADIRAILYRHIQTLSFGNLDQHNTGNLLVRLTTDVSRIQQMVMMGLGLMIMAPLLFIWGTVMIYITSPDLAVIMWVILPFTVLFTYIFARRAQPMFRGVQERLSRLNIILQENLTGMRTVKAFVRADYEGSRFGDANDALMHDSVEVNQFMAWVMPTLQLFINIGMVAVIWFGGNLTIDGSFTTGQIIAFVNYLGQALTPMMFLGQMLPQISAAEVSAVRITEVLDSEAQVQDDPDAQTIQRDAVQGRVVFEHVSFRYMGQNAGEDSSHDSSQDVLHDLNLTVEPGETVAILGATGSGKSSLVNLIPRFYDVDSGRITIDGVDVRDMTQESLRAQIGICLQEAVLFSGEIRKNIAYGASDLSDEQMVAVAKAADAHAFITGKADGYDTVLGQRGMGLSGGQQQRMSIARALARDPKILILDDSTSAVDVATEIRIQRALDALIGDRTTFIVAQRISTVLTADKIVVLDNGRVAAIGNHQELIASSPLYQEIYESQLGPNLGATLETQREAKQGAHDGKR